LNRPTIMISTSAAARYAAALPAKARAMAMPAIRPPRGGPTNWFIVISAA